MHLSWLSPSLLIAVLLALVLLLRERAALAGGRLDFGPAPGGGTCVRVWLPLQAAQGGGS